MTIVGTTRSYPSYSQATKAEEPLNEVSLNTPMAPKVASVCCKEIDIETEKENQENVLLHSLHTNGSVGIDAKTIEDRFRILSIHLKDRSVTDISRQNIIEVHQSLDTLYVVLKRWHALTHLKIVTKQHLTFIIRLIGSDEYKIATSEILFLYNNTNFYHADDLGEILLADFTTCNRYYLSTLKILILQVILKRKTMREYSSCILQLFAHDSRYILKDPKLKINSLVKLVLNFYSVLPEYSILFGLKFLQYIGLFKLSFPAYIKNTDISSFENRILQASGKLEMKDRKFLNIFYLGYSRYNQSLDKIMLLDILGKQHLDTQCPQFSKTSDLFQLCNKKTHNLECSCFCVDELNILLALMNKLLNDKSQVIENAVQILHCSWNTIYMEGFEKTKQILSTLDQTLSFIHTNLKKIPSTIYPALLDLFNVLSDIFINYDEFKRFGNIINVAFNIFVLSKDFTFLRKTVQLEVAKHFINQENTKIHQIIYRFEKFISNCVNITQKLEIFSSFFNIYFIINRESLFFILDFCNTVSAHCFTRLNLHNFVNFKNCSEVMVSIVYSNFSLDDALVKDWSIQTRMLYDSIIGCSDLTSSELSLKKNKLHFLSKYETLIRIVYLLNLDMNKHLSSNLLSITRLYIDKWITIQIDSNNEPLSWLEENFVKMLFQYLALNNFDKLTIELAFSLKEKNTYFAQLFPELEKWLFEAYVNLLMIENINIQAKYHPKLPFDFKTVKLDLLLITLESQLDIISWKNDYNSFHSLFIEKLPKLRSEIFDLNNKTNLAVPQYIRILLLNIKIFNTNAKLHLHENDVIFAALESKKAYKLSVSLIKKQDLLSQSSRLTLLRYLSYTYITLIKTYVRIGTVSDCEFFVNDLSNLTSNLGEPAIMYKCLHSLYEYYTFTEQLTLADSALEKANKIFEYLDEKSDILSSTTFLYDNKEYGRIQQSLALFFGKDLSTTFMPQCLRLQLGENIDDSISLLEYKVLNDINKLENMWKHIFGELELEPVFKEFFESILSISPFTARSMDQSRNGESVVEAFRDSIFPQPPESSRSSSMTPKIKGTRKLFDQKKIVILLKTIKNYCESIDLDSLKNYQVSRVSSLFSMIVSALFNIDRTCLGVDVLLHDFSLKALPRHMVSFFDKILNTLRIEKNLDFKLLPINTTKDNSLSLEINRLIKAQKNIMESKLSINIISIDVCPITGNLLLSKFEPITNQEVHLSVPLFRASARDLDEPCLSFIEAKEELLDIVKRSDLTSSAEITSKIRTREERKEWWMTRYALDKRLYTLLSTMETSWICGLKGFFSQEIIDRSTFSKFKETFYEILHQNLPSRKQFYNPSMFPQIEDSIIELFLKVNPQDTNFVAIMEDLLYFILDILSFQGEENAYDEIDFSALHVQFEEQIRALRSTLVGNSETVSHTFLNISSSCHFFPWECLSFLNNLSITRVPSFIWLDEMIQKYKNQISFPVSLKENISLVLNPNGDLPRTESRFKDIFQSIRDTIPNSQLILNEKPKEEQFLNMLTSSNFFIYIGHGGGEQYVRSRKIKSFDTVAPSFLLGCSSASIKYYGKLEPTGTMYAYLLGGSPMVLGNLWDVTDKDIDKFSQEIFDRMGLNAAPEEIPGSNLTVSQAVAASREVCHLRYLNGAAPVVYGLPIHFTF